MIFSALIKTTILICHISLLQASDASSDIFSTVNHNREYPQNIISCVESKVQKNCHFDTKTEYHGGHSANQR